MTELFLNAKFAGSKNNLLTLSLGSSGFLGIKKDILYFSPNLMFFEENEIIAQILYKGEPKIIIRPQIELEMHYLDLKQTSLENNRLLKLVLKNSFENLMIGDDIYVKNNRYSFCMQVSKELVKLSKVKYIVKFISFDSEEKLSKLVF
jgi:hypothetical protein